MMMEQIEKQGLGSSLPILQRLDRVERLVQFLEEKKSLSGTGRHSPSSTGVIRNTTAHDEVKWKTLSSALDEVGYKGTLLERLEMIENRVLQLQLNMKMDMENKLTSSYSSFTPSEKLETLSNPDDDSFKIQENAIEMECGRNSQVSEKSKMQKRGAKVTRRKKWLKCLNLRTCGK